LNQTSSPVYDAQLGVDSVSVLVEYKFVPKVAGCYVLTTFDNYILYIGLSINPLNTASTFFIAFAISGLA
jgi:hypothetical protein